MNNETKVIGFFSFIEAAALAYAETGRDPAYSVQKARELAREVCTAMGHESSSFAYSDKPKVTRHSPCSRCGATEGEIKREKRT